MAILEKIRADLAEISGSDDHDIQETVAQISLTEPVTVVVKQSVVFEIEKDTQPGKLPSNISPVADPAAFSHQLGISLFALQHDRPERLSDWSQSNDGTYRRLLKPEAFLSNEGRTIGYERVCQACEGACHLQCQKCAGHGILRCGDCGGHGRYTCGACNGTTSLTCPSCHGKPIRYEHVQESVWNPQTNSFESRARPVDYRCQTCNVTGRVRCQNCQSDGQVTCGGCGGDGRVDCRNCGTTGTSQCKQCGATGCEHVTGRITATVNLSEEMFGNVQDKKLEKLIGQKIPIRSVAQYGTMSGCSHEAGESEVTSTYQFDLSIQKATLKYARASHTLFSFGEQGEILDHGDIFSQIHDTNTKDFEKLVDSGYPFSLHRANKLLTGFDKFQKNAYAKTFSTYPDASPEKVKEAAEAAQGQITWLAGLNITYVTRRFIHALFNTYTLKWVALILAASVAMFFYKTSSAFSICAWSHRAWTFVFAAVLLLLLEFITQQRVMGVLTGKVEKSHVESVIKDHRLRWRIGALLAALFVVWASVYIKAFVYWQMYSNSFPCLRE